MEGDAQADAIAGDVGEHDVRVLQWRMVNAGFDGGRECSHTAAVDVFTPFADDESRRRAVARGAQRDSLDGAVELRKVGHALTREGPFAAKGIDERRGFARPECNVAPTPETESGASNYKGDDAGAQGVSASAQAPGGGRSGRGYPNPGRPVHREIQERRRGQPRKKRRPLDGIAQPAPAGAGIDVGPPHPTDDPDRDEKPGDRGPAPRR